MPCSCTDRVFDRFFQAPLFGETFLPAFPFEQMATVGGEWTPMLDLTETDKEYVVRCEVPGIHKVGKFVRTLKSPVPVEEGKIEAAYQDGILTVHVPKAATAVAKKILIK